MTEEKTLEDVALPEETDLDADKECALEALEGCLEDSQESELSCKICQEVLRKPKLLACFHTFCEECLGNVVHEASDTIDGEPIKPADAVECKVCKQMTPLPNGKVEDLMGNLLLEDRLNPSSDSTVIICTSCKAKEKAIAHCAKCPNYLCTNCMAAHQFMRCFDDHVVESFEDILKSGRSLSQPKPVLCEKHADENLVSFCNNCQVAVCQKCMLMEHLEHICIPLSEADGPNSEDLRRLVEQAHAKLRESQEVSKTTGTDFTDLDEQKENARDLITETFQSYKFCLEKIRDKMLDELVARHNKIELAQMENIQIRSNIEARLESVCSFAKNLLSEECSTYASVYKKKAQDQLVSLMSCSLESGVSGNIEFKTDVTAFENAVAHTFGWFVSEEAKMPVVAPFDGKGTFDDMSMVPGMIATADQLVGHGVSNAEFLTPSLPTMSNVSQLAALSTNFESLPTISSIVSLAGSQVMAPMDAVSRSSVSPAMSDSGISMDSGNSNNSANILTVNIARLSKISSGNQGVMTPAPLTEVTTSSAAGSGSTSRTQTPMGQGAESMQAMMPVSPPIPTENLEQLTTLMHSQPPPPSLPFTNSIASMELPPVTGGAVEIGAAGMGSPTGAGTATPYPPVRRPNKLTAMQIRCKFGQLGPGKCQFNSPHGFCLGIEQDIIVADTNNHRIQVFEKTGEFKTQFGIPGREEGQLWYPRKVAVMRPSGKFVVCDRGNERSRMQIFTRSGHFMKKIAIRYIDIVAGLAITASGNIVAVDSVSPTVFVISEAGELVKWFDCSDYMREPSDIAVSNKEYFVCDFKGHCVVVFNEEGGFLRRIGCENITNYPNGIDISDAGDVLIGDSHGNRFHVAVFQRDGSLIGEFQCPYVKVSRCCGLKITSEGYVVTLAKNNHHVLVLNTLYIQ